LILQDYNDFVEETYFDIIGVTSVVSIGGIGVVFDGVVKSSPIPRVCDSSIAVAFGGLLFNILPSVPSFSYNVIVGSIDHGSGDDYQSSSWCIWCWFYGLKEECGASCKFWHWQIWWI
jgi:hypothetical protein